MIHRAALKLAVSQATGNLVSFPIHASGTAGELLLDGHLRLSGLLCGDKLECLGLIAHSVDLNFSLRSLNTCAGDMLALAWVVGNAETASGNGLASAFAGGHGLGECEEDVHRLVGTGLRVNLHLRCNLGWGLSVRLRLGMVECLETPGQGVKNNCITVSIRLGMVGVNWELHVIAER